MHSALQHGLHACLLPREGRADGPLCAGPCFACVPASAVSPAHLLAAIRFDSPSLCLQLELMQASILLGSFVEVVPRAAAAARRERGGLKLRRSSLDDCGSIGGRSTTACANDTAILAHITLPGPGKSRKGGNDLCFAFASLVCVDPSWTVTWQGGMRWGEGEVSPVCWFRSRCVLVKPKQSSRSMHAQLTECSGDEGADRLVHCVHAHTAHCCWALWLQGTLND